MELVAVVRFEPLSFGGGLWRGDEVEGLGREMWWCFVVLEMTCCGLFGCGVVCGIGGDFIGEVGEGIEGIRCCSQSMSRLYLTLVTSSKPIRNPRVSKAHLAFMILKSLLFLQ